MPVQRRKASGDILKSGELHLKALTPSPRALASPLGTRANGATAALPSNRRQRWHTGSGGAAAAAAAWAALALAALAQSHSAGPGAEPVS
ncbi:hypothetical protein EYF80_044788 [Liparis tanakae]|uniref:Uncharacterized protein n=1 Tax=Liparis tanakae TaxID=230148 RepID=A0A4Z2FUY5_9TELE|nr:hypothetical protein EYF80_044788 [Liparis tanakae]